MTTTTDDLRWNDAVDAALEPTDLDRNLDTTGVFGLGAPLIGPDGKLAHWPLVRERAARAYLAVHEGEVARVTYRDPALANESGSSMLYSVTGELHRRYVMYAAFEEGRAKTVRGFLVGDHVVPFAGLSSIEALGDRATVVL